MKLPFNHLHIYFSFLEVMVSYEDLNDVCVYLLLDCWSWRESLLLWMGLHKEPPFKGAAVKHWNFYTKMTKNKNTCKGQTKVLRWTMKICSVKLTLIFLWFDAQLLLFIYFASVLYLLLSYSFKYCTQVIISLCPEKHRHTVLIKIAAFLVSNLSWHYLIFQQGMSKYWLNIMNRTRSVSNHSKFYNKLNN